MKAVDFTFCELYILKVFLPQFLETESRC